MGRYSCPSGLSTPQHSTLFLPSPPNLRSRRSRRTPWRQNVRRCGRSSPTSSRPPHRDAPASAGPPARRLDGQPAGRPAGRLDGQSARQPAGRPDGQADEQPAGRLDGQPAGCCDGRHSQCHQCGQCSQKAAATADASHRIPLPPHT
eukprot:191289-Chlamydomonas_euryale.AAC.1